VELVHALGAIPVFRRNASGVFIEDWDGGGEPDGLALAALDAKAPSSE
jgi:hypothetical protein